jgi:DNA-binding NtrC family response regulator
LRARQIFVERPPVKEPVAKAIQRLGARRERPFEKLHCADLTRELLRSELFGHRRGAFTGAMSRTAGLVSRLHGGTLFMDENGELASGRPGDAASVPRLEMA